MQKRNNASPATRWEGSTARTSERNSWQASWTLVRLFLHFLRISPHIIITPNRSVIPEGTAITIAPYAMHRDPRYFFPDPDVFRPERWLSEGSGSAADSYGSDEKDEGGTPIANHGFRHNTAAFLPFSTGPAICAGKNLALFEMRLVVSYLVCFFNVCGDAAAGYDPARWDGDLQDWFMLRTGRLPVVLTPRRLGESRKTLLV